jgi:hypothetical protein
MLWKLATDSTASTFNRLEAIDLLLRLAVGPRNRSADSVDVVASHNARIALWNANTFLVQTMTSRNNRARIRLHAATLGTLVGRLSGCTGHGSRQRHLPGRPMRQERMQIPAAEWAKWDRSLLNACSQRRRG